MNYNNRNNEQEDFNPVKGSWGNFSSRYDRQKNYNNSDNTKNSNYNNDNEPIMQYQSPLADSNFNELRNTNMSNRGRQRQEPALQQSNFNSDNSLGNYAANSNNNFFNRHQGFKGNRNNNFFNQSQEGQRNHNNNFFDGSQDDLGNNNNNFCNQEDQRNSNNDLFDQSQQDQWNPNNNFVSQRFRSRSNSAGRPNNRGGARLSRSSGNNTNKNNYNNNNRGKFQNSNTMNQSSNSNNAQNNSSSSYVPFRKFRQHFAGQQNNRIKEDNIQAPSLFMGRDISYPNELNELMKPFFCGVCNCRVNSIKCANVHYESKAHDKRISNWLKINFSDQGIEAPAIKRFVTEEAISPYRCELCKLELTSGQHALQHYNGKKHRNVATKISPPTGVGYYNVDGNWVETGKVLDKKTGKEASYILVSTPAGFEPVVLYCSATKQNLGLKKVADSEAIGQPPSKKPNLNTTPSATNATTQKNEEELKKINPDSTTNNQCDSNECSNTTQAPEDALSSLQCKVCGIATTSYDQMFLHLKGIRHTKKLRALGEPPIVDKIIKVSTTILESLNTNDSSDISIYRTPTGSYYCKSCDVAVSDVAGIKNHILSKVHLAAIKKEE